MSREKSRKTVTGFYTEQRGMHNRKLLRLQPSHGEKVYMYEWDHDLYKIVGRWVDTRSEEEKKDTQD